MIYILRHEGLKEEGVYTFSLLGIRYLNASLKDVKGCEFLVLSSKYALSWIQKTNNLDSLKHLEVLSVGKSTARLCEKAGLKVAFVGSGGIKDLANKLEDRLKGSCLLYLKAKKSAFSAREVFLDSITKEVVVYETFKKPFFYVPGLRARSAVVKSLLSLFREESIFIFSAPSHFESFYQAFGWRKDFYALAIGKTTFEAIKTSLKTSKNIFCEDGLKECLLLAKKMESKILTSA
ncbi:hypothetical protein BKH43_03540 [Helicobacter sp. 13S00401-1]|uniref:uroporphyrinogen-III synthase n=1 Tax=Helicobacter sp. 13S00401-1 TaxID=1905758 RepID=UPI000BA6291F|nr:uroporphyrinogen-III synthase [Helicobacter sp. 13S00401-1]PAF50940.1 hypothetical protein BKH43_03540 [Helicobacter sp. 13S00401-1]